MSLWRSLKRGVIQCLACQHHCTILPGKSGKCGVRVNNGGKMEVVVYGKPLGIHLDPIEKKPLFHFIPGTLTLSFGTFGCNMKCPFCQNWHMTSEKLHEKFAEAVKDIEYIEPERIVEMAIEAGAPSISFTYNEPVVFAEYMLDIVKIAKREGVRTVMVSNGMMSKHLRKHLRVDAINIDLKVMDEGKYREIGGHLGTVLDNIRWFHESGVWVEVTTLLVTGFSDSIENIGKVAEFLSSVSPSIPWHVSRYFPHYLYSEPPTNPQILEKAHDIGKEKGLKYIYIGNMPSDKESTYCPSCGEMLISRSGFDLAANLIKDGRCPYCSEVIEGVWD